MPEPASKEPLDREDRNSPSAATGGLLKFLAYSVAAYGAYKGGGYVLRQVNPKLIDTLRTKIASGVINTVDAINKQPIMKAVTKAFNGDPQVAQHKVGTVLDRAVRDVGIRKLGLIQDLEAILKLDAPPQDLIDHFKQSVLVKYERDIPAQSIGRYSRMTFDDLLRATHQNPNLVYSTPVLKYRNVGSLAQKLQMPTQDLLGLRLDPWLFYDRSSQGKGIFNVSNLNIVGRGLEALENWTPGGIPFFRIRNDPTANHRGAAIFGGFSSDKSNIPNPVVRMLTGQSRGQVAVVGGQAWARYQQGHTMRMVPGANNLGFTTDFRIAEMTLRGKTSNAEFDALAYPRKPGQGFWNKLQEAVGFGPKYIQDPSETLFGRITARGKPGISDRILKALDPTGIVDSRFLPNTSSGLASNASKIGAESRLSKVYLKQTGAAGFFDYLNAQVSRPFYIPEIFGVGIRPGRTALHTLGKISGMAFGAYMGYQALQYADWAMFNAPSRAASKILGGAILARQTLLDATGARSGIERTEGEFPGLFNSPLAQALRVAGMAIGGGYLGRALGGPSALMFAGKVAKRELPLVMRQALHGALQKQRGNTSGVVGSILGLGTGAILGLGTLGNLSERPQAVRERIAGLRKDPYRASAGWVLGHDPYAGGRIRFYKPSFLHAGGTDYTSIGVYGSEGNKWRYGSWLPTPQNWFGLRRLMNPYYAEERNYNTRPYPATSGEFGEFPIFGPILQSTVGSLIKPTRYRNTPLGGGSNIAGVAAAGGTYSGSPSDMYGGTPSAGTSIGLGPVGTRPAGVDQPNNLALGIGYQMRALEEYIGLRGFQMQFIREHLFGRSEVNLSGPVLEQSGKMGSAARSYYDLEPGGLLGMTEFPRRFLLRPFRQPSVNLIPNTMPNWLPGTNSAFLKDRKYYNDFLLGDPYTKIPIGEARLPGPGRDALYPLHGGGAYDLLDSFLVLADVAPFTQAYKVMKVEIERQIRKGNISGDWVRRYLIAVEQAETRSDFRVFHSNKFTQTMEGTVDKILSPTSLTLKERPGEVITLSNRLVGNPNELIAERISAGLTPEQAEASIGSDKARLQGILESMRNKKISLQQTGTNAGRIVAESEDLKEVYSEMGIANKDRLYDQGLAGKAYTRAGKSIGELGFLAGGIYGAIEGSLFGKAGNVIQAKSPAARALTALAGAAVGGIVGGWAENKFTGDFTAVEHYNRFQKYGTSFASWSTPYQSFIRPWAQSAAGAVINYTPGHRKEQYGLEQYFDVLKYMKYSSLEGMARESGAGDLAQEYNKEKRATLIGLNYGALGAYTEGLYDAIPASERQYFKQFVAEQSPNERKKIVDAVPDYMKSVYLAIWKNNEKADFEDSDLRAAYDEYVQPLIDTPVQERVSNYASQVSIPDNSWMGWNPSVDLSDVKYKTIDMTGGALHNHGLFSSEGKRIEAFQPFISEIADELPSSYSIRPTTRANSLRKLASLIDGGSNTINARSFNRLAYNSVDIQVNNQGRYADYNTKYASGRTGIY